MRLVAIFALAALPLASCGGEQEETPVVETEVVAEGEENAETLAPTDQSLADPAAPSVTEPPGGATATPSPDTPVASDETVDPEAVGEQYQDFVGGEEN